MKNLNLYLVLLCCFIGSLTATAQVKIGNNPNTIDASAILELESTTKGFLISRMTQAQRDAIATPATGLMIYQTDATPGYYYNSGTPGAPVWSAIGSGSGLNIYNGDGTLTGARTVNLGGNTLTFNTGATNGATLQSASSGINKLSIIPTTTLGATNTIVNAGDVLLSLRSTTGGQIADATAVNTRGVVIAPWTDAITANGLKVTERGHVGISNAAPGSRLHVGSSIFAGVIGMAIQNTEGIGRIGIANVIGDFGAPLAGDFMLSGNTAGKGIGFNTSMGTAMYIANAGNVGIGTGTPGSTLQTTGSFAGNYTGVTANTYALLANDYFTSWDGTAAGTFTLPDVTNANVEGRIYIIKNSDPALDLIINPAAGETIDGAASITVTPGNSAQLAATGALTGSAWEVVSVSAAGATATGTIYTSNGTLTGNRNVNLSTFDLGFTGAGKVGIGTGSPASSLHINKSSNAGHTLTVPNGSNGAVTTTSTFYPEIMFGAGGGVSKQASIASWDNGQFGGGLAFLTHTNTGSDNWPTGVNQSMLITPIGNVGIGTNAPVHRLDVQQNVAGFVANISNANTTVAAGTGVLRLAMPATGVGYRFVTFVYGGGELGSIQNTGGALQYNTTSDIRLKENIQPTAKGLTEVMKIQVRDYNYKSDDAKTAQTGFLAQQLYTIYPVAVTKGGDDATKEPWQVDYSKLTPLLVKSVQDLKNELDAVKAENAALKATATASVSRAEHDELKAMVAHLLEQKQATTTTTTVTNEKK